MHTQGSDVGASLTGNPEDTYTCEQNISKGKYNEHGGGGDNDDGDDDGGGGDDDGDEVHSDDGGDEDDGDDNDGYHHDNNDGDADHYDKEEHNDIEDHVFKDMVTSHLTYPGVFPCQTPGVYFRRLFEF